MPGSILRSRPLIPISSLTHNDLRLACLQSDPFGSSEGFEPIENRSREGPPRPSSRYAFSASSNPVRTKRTRFRFHVYRSRCAQRVSGAVAFASGTILSARQAQICNERLWWISSDRTKRTCFGRLLCFGEWLPWSGIAVWPNGSPLLPPSLNATARTQRPQ